MRYVVRQNGVAVELSSGHDGFTSEKIALAYARAHSASVFRGVAVTVHDGDAAAERNVVAVFRNGVQVGPTHEDNGY